MKTGEERNISVTTALIIANIAVFVLGYFSTTRALFGIPFPSSPPASAEPTTLVRGAYSWYTCFMEGEVWRLITYQFLHSSPMHLIFNMWALFFFGPAVEQAMGARRYLIFYLACGVAGALFSSLLSAQGFFAPPDSPMLDHLMLRLSDVTGCEGLEFWEVVPMVGASAAIYGVLVSVAFLYPHLHVSLIFPPVTMTLRTFAIAVLLIAILTVLLNGDNAGGEAGHLGGIILSAIVMLIWRNRYRKKLYGGRE